MPFREKSAWGSLIAILAGYGVYFWLVAPRLSASPDRSPPYLGLLFGCMVGMVALQAGLQAGLAIAAPADARLKPDERERLIMLKSDRVAMVVLATLAGAGWTLYAFAPGWVGNAAMAANLVLLALVIAAAAKFASAILYFHRTA